MTQEQSERSPGRPLSDDDSPIWSLRGVAYEIRHRMKVKATLERTTLPTLVERACQYWLEQGAPE